MVEKLFQWPVGSAAELRDGLTTRDVIEALYAPVTLRMDNRVPSRGADVPGGVRAHRAAAVDHRRLYPDRPRRAVDHPGSPGSEYERAGDVEEAHIMNKPGDELAGAAADEAAAYAMDHDLGDMFDQAEVVRGRRPAKMVTALRIDLDVQAEIEAVAAARGIGISTLMRQIIEEWVAAHRGSAVPDQLGELVRHLDAARRAADSLAQHAA